MNSDVTAKQGEAWLEKASICNGRAGQSNEEQRESIEYRGFAW